MRIKQAVITNEGKRIVGNALTGASIGLHQRSATRGFWREAIRGSGLTAATWAAAQVTSSEVLAKAINRLRLIAPRDSEKRLGVRTDHIPMFAFKKDKESILGNDVHTVVTLPTLSYVISPGDKKRDGFDALADLKRDSSPGELAKSVIGIRKIPKKRRHFELAEDRSLGNPIMWFTSDSALGSIEASFKAAKKAFPGTKADWYVASLGLGHHRPGTWLAVLHIPKQVIERAGHYRPVFCDGAGFPWFMAGCSDSACRQPPSNWGQTANLYSVLQNMPDIDGASERVSREIFRKDFVLPSGNYRIHFDLLGMVSRDLGTDTAATNLANKIWNDRSR